MGIECVRTEIYFDEEMNNGFYDLYNYLEDIYISRLAMPSVFTPFHGDTVCRQSHNEPRFLKWSYSSRCARCSHSSGVVIVIINFN